MNPAIQLLQELIREDLQLGWSHLEDGREDMALHHLASAAEKIEQIKNLKCTEALNAPRPTQSTLIDTNPKE